MSCEFAGWIERLRGELSPRERVRFESHAMTCPACASDLRHQAEIDAAALALRARPLALATREETSQLVRVRAPEKEPMMLKPPFLPPVRRARVLAMGALVAACTLFLTVPIPYSRTVGQSYEMRLSAAPAPRAVEALAMGLREAFSKSSLNTQIVGTNLRVDVRGAGPGEALLRAAARGAGLEVASVTHAPLREPARGSLYAQVAQRVYRLDLTQVNNATPDEVAAQIRQQLESQGLQNVDLDVQKNEKGGLQVHAHVKDATTGQKPQFEVQASPGATIQQFHLEDLPGASLEEKGAALQRLLAEKGIKSTVEVRNGQLRIEAKP